LELLKSHVGGPTTRAAEPAARGWSVLSDAFEHEALAASSVRGMARHAVAAGRGREEVAGARRGRDGTAPVEEEDEGILSEREEEAEYDI
jgi:hypothetical protein